MAICMASIAQAIAVAQGEQKDRDYRIRVEAVHGRFTSLLALVRVGYSILGCRFFYSCLVGCILEADPRRATALEMLGECLTAVPSSPSSPNSPSSPCSCFPCLSSLYYGQFMQPKSVDRPNPVILMSSQRHSFSLPARMTARTDVEQRNRTRLWLQRQPTNPTTTTLAYESQSVMGENGPSPPALVRRRPQYKRHVWPLALTFSLSVRAVGTGQFRNTISQTSIKRRDRLSLCRLSLCEFLIAHNSPVSKTQYIEDR